MDRRDDRHALPRRHQRLSEKRPHHQACTCAAPTTERRLEPLELLHHTRTLESIRGNSFEKGQEISYYKIINSPVGLLTLVAKDDALLKLTWGDNTALLPADCQLSAGRNVNAIIKLSELQLSEYFKKKRSTFDIPLAPQGTPFQLKVWQQLRNIPHGSYITYGEQAARLGSPNAARAVGAANGKNPISIIVPCHRVIGASGHLTGFAGGLKTKQLLLELEGALQKR